MSDHNGPAVAPDTPPTPGWLLNALDKPANGDRGPARMATHGELAVRLAQVEAQMELLRAQHQQRLREIDRILDAGHAEYVIAENYPAVVKALHEARRLCLLGLGIPVGLAEALKTVSVKVENEKLAGKAEARAAYLEGALRSLEERLAAAAKRAEDTGERGAAVDLQVFAEDTREAWQAVGKTG